MKITKSRLAEIVREVVQEEKTEYEKFFRGMLKKHGVSSPAELSDEEKKKFFNQVDAEYKAKHEGNAFGAAVTKAKEKGEDEFEVGGKTYKVEESAGCGCGCGGVTEGGCKTNISERLTAAQGLAHVMKGQSSRIEGIKLSKELATAMDNWVRNSPYGRKYGKHMLKAPFHMLLKPMNSSFGLEKRLSGKVKAEFKDLIKKHLNEAIFEGRAFVQAARKAKEEGKTEFEFNGKTYPVTLKD